MSLYDSSITHNVTTMGHQKNNANAKRNRKLQIMTNQSSRNISDLDRDKLQVMQIQTKKIADKNTWNSK